MDVAEVHMSENDILVVLNVCENLPETIFDGLDIISVINSLKRLHVINSERHRHLLQYYDEISRTSRCETLINKFYCFFRTITGYVPFFGFCAALENVGYIGLSQDLILGRDKYGTTVSRGVMKRDLPNAKRIHSYYAHLKRCADNNFFENQTFSVLSQMIDSLGSEICVCPDINRLQLLVDKRCVLYFLLCQQRSCVHDRNEVLKQMRDSMPRGVDRTVFDTIFHSYMAFNWAVSGNAETAEKHEKQARVACNSCVAGFVCFVMTLWSQYKNNILYLKSNCSAKSYYNQAKTSFEIIQQYLEDISGSDDDENIWKTISALDMARSTVGIHSKLEVCDINRIDSENLEYGNNMLSLMPLPRDIRRRMYYFVIRGRLYEKSDRPKAKQYVEEGMKLVGDGCYDETEKRNIEKYLKSLKRGELPRPSL